MRRPTTSHQRTDQIFHEGRLPERYSAVAVEVVKALVRGARR
jgi:hypothetical protein